MNSEKRELEALRVLVTRSSDQAGGLSKLLTELGASPIEIPVIEFKEPSSWAPLDTALKSLEQYDWIIFASSNAVERTARRAEELGLWTRLKESHPKIASIGSATTKKLSERGLTVTYQPSSFVAEALIDQFPNKSTLNGQRVLWPKTDIGRTLIADELQKLGADVEIVQSYSTGIPENARVLGQRLYELLKGGQIDVITLASAQTAKNLAEILWLGMDEDFQLCTDRPMLELLKNTQLATIGPITSNAAEKAMKPVEIEAEEYTVKGLLNAIVKWKHKIRKQG